jgi:hypothetical protein
MLEGKQPEKGQPSDILPWGPHTEQATGLSWSFPAHGRMLTAASDSTTEANPPSVTFASPRLADSNPWRTQGRMRAPLRIAVLLLAVGIVLFLLPEGAPRPPRRERLGPLTPTASTRITNKSRFGGCKADGKQRGDNNPNSEVEPSIGVNPTNPSNVVATWQQDRWSNGGARALPVAVSNDGGTTWKVSGRSDGPRVTVCSGGTTRNGGGYQRASDPWVSFAPNGDLYHTSLSFNRRNRESAVLVSKSTDGGATWSDPVVLKKDARAFNDKETVTADPRTAPESPISAAYAIWTRDGDAWFSRTSDGSSWTGARRILKEGFSVAHQTVVNRSGRLIDIFSLFKSGNRNYIGVIRSKDRDETPGDSWSRPTIISRFDFVSPKDPDTGQKIRSGEALPGIATDPRTGNVYAVWQDLVFSAAGKRYSGIAFSMSSNGGRRWSRPVRINQPGARLRDPNDQAFIPSIHVATDGTIGVSYYDFRQNTDAQSVSTDYWLVRCPARSRRCTRTKSWTERHVAGPFDLEMAPKSVGLFIGDYMSMTGEGRDFLLCFVQATLFTSNRTNVYFRRM